MSDIKIRVSIGTTALVLNWLYFVKSWTRNLFSDRHLSSIEILCSIKKTP